MTARGHEGAGEPAKRRTRGGSRRRTAGDCLLLGGAIVLSALGVFLLLTAALSLMVASLIGDATETAGDVALWVLWAAEGVFLLWRGILRAQRFRAHRPLGRTVDLPTLTSHGLLAGGLVWAALTVLEFGVGGGWSLFVYGVYAGIPAHLVILTRGLVARRQTRPGASGAA